MLNAIKKFLKEEDGLTALEYAIAGGVITAGLVAAFGIIGTNAVTLIERLRDAIVLAAA